MEHSAFVTRCDSEGEASEAAAVLEARGIEFSVVRVEERQGADVSVSWELHVLPARQEEASAALLEAEAVAEAERAQPGVADARSGSTCPEHGVEMTLPCERCGTFVCAQCVEGQAATCDRCEDLAWQDKRQRLAASQNRLMGLGLIALLALAGVALWVRFH